MFRQVTYVSFIQPRLSIKLSYVSLMGMPKRYTNIPLPEDLAMQIERVINTAELGYKTKSEFVKDAVRGKLIELGKFEGFKKKK